MTRILVGLAALAILLVALGLAAGRFWPSGRLNAAPRASAVDYGAPGTPFATVSTLEGEINGLTFYDPAKGTQSVPYACAGLPFGGVDASPAEIQASSLNFKPGYLPAGMTEINSGGNKCRDDVAVVVRNYAGQDYSFIAILHVAAPPVLQADGPFAALQPADIGGRPAVIRRPAGIGLPLAIYLRDAGGYWMVTAIRKNLNDPISADEVIRVAASLQ